MANAAVTISGTRVVPLSEQERAATGYNAKFRVIYSDINASTATTAGDVVTLTLGATPSKWYVDRAGVNITTAFAGITAMTLIVGTTSSTAALISSTSILTAAFLNQVSTVPVLTNLTATAAVNLVATFTAAGTGGPAALSAGQLDIYLRVIDTTQLP